MLNDILDLCRFDLTYLNPPSQNFLGALCHVTLNTTTTNIIQKRARHNADKHSFFSFRFPRAAGIPDEYLYPGKTRADQAEPIRGGPALLPLLHERRRRAATGVSGRIVRNTIHPHPHPHPLHPHPYRGDVLQIAAAAELYVILYTLTPDFTPTRRQCATTRSCSLSVRLKSSRVHFSSSL